MIRYLSNILFILAAGLLVLHNIYPHQHGTSEKSTSQKGFLECLMDSFETDLGEGHLECWTDSDVESNLQDLSFYSLPTRYSLKSSENNLEPPFDYYYLFYFKDTTIDSGDQDRGPPCA